MKHRIITHEGCTDGFCSAFIFKKYFHKLLELTPEQMQDVEVVLVKPRDVQLGEVDLEPGDIVLDLPQPNSTVFFWADHHKSTKLEETNLPKNYYWGDNSSCSGLLLEIAEREGLKLTSNLKEFKVAIDKNDSANFTKKEIQEIFYEQKDYSNPSMLQKFAFLSAMFKTKDINLNDVLFTGILNSKLGETPVDTQIFKYLQPLLFHKARLKGMSEWREQVDEYVDYNQDAKCVIQDTRKIRFQKGVVDRFYVYLKFIDSAYNIVIKELVNKEGQVMLGLGSNIFHKDRCKVDLGKLCRDVGKKFGAGSGGGHYYVAGSTVAYENVDLALKFILEKFREAENN